MSMLSSTFWNRWNSEEKIGTGPISCLRVRWRSQPAACGTVSQLPRLQCCPMEAADGMFERSRSEDAGAQPQALLPSSSRNWRTENGSNPSPDGYDRAPFRPHAHRAAHQTAAGVDALALSRKYTRSIKHIHLKDIRRIVADRIRPDWHSFHRGIGAGMMETSRHFPKISRPCKRRLYRLDLREGRAGPGESRPTSMYQDGHAYLARF